MKKHILIIGVLLCINTFLIAKIDKLQLQQLQELNQQPTMIPTAKSLKRATAGFEAIASDLLWLQAIQYTGAHAQSEGFLHLGHYIQTITDVYPHFEYAYEFASFIVPTHDPQLANELAQKGKENLPESFQIPFNQAFIQFYHLGDNEAALKTVTELKKKHPDKKSLTAMQTALLSRLGRHQVALAIWQEKLLTAKNQQEAEFFISRIKRESGYLAIKEAIAKYGKPKQDLQEIINPVPESGSDSLEFVWKEGEVILQLKKTQVY